MGNDDHARLLPGIVERRNELALFRSVHVCSLHRAQGARVTANALCGLTPCCSCARANHLARAASHCCGSSHPLPAPATPTLVASTLTPTPWLELSEIF